MNRFRKIRFIEYNGGLHVYTLPLMLTTEAMICEIREEVNK